MEIKTNQEIYSINLSNDSKKLVLCLDNKVIEIWDIEHFTKIGEINSIKKLVDNIILTYNNNYLIFTDEKHTINKWDCKLGRISLKINEFVNEISPIKETPDGKKIIVGCQDNNIKVWNLTGELILILKGVCLVSSCDAINYYKQLQIYMKSIWYCDLHTVTYMRLMEVWI